MRKNFIRAVSIFLLIFMFGCTMSAYAESSKEPDWIKRIRGEEVKPKTQEEIEQEEKLEAWKEKKATQKVPILLYHHITTDSFSDDDSISLISPEDFRLHMTAIKTNFSPISLREYCDYVKCEDGSRDIPDNAIIVTFDDGYSSNYEIAYPILKSLEIPATIFVVTDTVGAKAGEGKVNNSHFTWEEAKEMEASGLIDIQSHTVNHARVTDYDFAEQIRQIRKSKYDIEKNLGHICDMIAYPYGDYNENIKQMARDAGYTVQLLVDDKTTEDAYEVNTPSEGVEKLTRMTIAGSMGNVNVLEIIRKTLNRKRIS